MISGFKNFVLRGNVADLAVGIVIGIAFKTVIDSLVADILTPLIAAIFKQPDFSKLAVNLNGSQIMYGSFLNSIISFLIVALAVYFFVVTPLNKLMSKAGVQSEITGKE